MADDHIATYLNDHLAGSVVAVELMENLEAVYAGKPIADFIAKLRADIEAELDRTSEVLTERVKTLARRYATPLPKIVADVQALSANVDEHLKRMGFEWS